ncbi:MAG: peptidoglycan-binding domain-containing protein [Patescibacteria group bacterium]
MTFNKIVFGSILVLVFGFGVALYSMPHSAFASAISTLAGRDLTVGSRGDDVSDLQGFLGEQGYLAMPVGVPFGYFGSLTQSALKNYQASIGVSSTGYYGPITRMKMVQVFTTNGWMALLASGNR